MSHPVCTGQGCRKASAWRLVKCLTAAAAFVVLLGIVAWLGNQQVEYVFQLGNTLSPRSDPESEVGSIRAGECFAIGGFNQNCGLPDVLYGDQFPTHGLKKYRPLDTHWVYTHYPPGPDWLAGLATLGFGLRQLPWYRLVPISLALVSMVFLGCCLIRVLGGVRAVGAMLLFAWVPLFTNMMHGLSYQSYAFSLLLVQLGVLLVAFEGGRHPWALPALGLLGFLQGWFSFDYFFLVSLCAIPCWAFQHGRQQPGERNRLLWYVVVPCFGFALAHLIHFGQVAAYHGSVSAAINDFQTIAKARLRGFDGEVESLADKLHLWVLFPLYFDDLSTEAYFNFSFHRLLLGAGLALLVHRARLDLGRFLPVRAAWDGSGWNVLMLVGAFLVSGLWVVAMPGHAYYHQHYIPRHFFLFYFFCVVFALRSFSVDVALARALQDWVAKAPFSGGSENRAVLRTAAKQLSSTPS